MTNTNEPDATPSYPEFRPGQRVRDIYGVEHTVLRQEGCQVFMRERSGWWHPTKVWPVDGSAR